MGIKPNDGFKRIGISQFLIRWGMVHVFLLSVLTGGLGPWLIFGISFFFFFGHLPIRELRFFDCFACAGGILQPSKSFEKQHISSVLPCNREYSYPDTQTDPIPCLQNFHQITCEKSHPWHNLHRWRDHAPPLNESIIWMPYARSHWRGSFWCILSHNSAFSPSPHSTKGIQLWLIRGPSR